MPWMRAGDVLQPGDPMGPDVVFVRRADLARRDARRAGRDVLWKRQVDRDLRARRGDVVFERKVDRDRRARRASVEQVRPVRADVEQREGRGGADAQHLVVIELHADGLALTESSSKVGTLLRLDLHRVPVDAEPHDVSPLSWRSLWRRLRTVARRISRGEQ